MIYFDNQAAIRSLANVSSTSVFIHECREIQRNYEFQETGKSSRFALHTVWQELEQSLQVPLLD